MAAAFAITAGGLGGRFATSGKERILLVRAARNGIQRPRIEEAALVRMVLDAYEVEAGLFRRGDPLEQLVGLGGVRHGEDPELDGHTAPTLPGGAKRLA